MSQASHNDPERYYQESLHRVPATDAYRDECRDELEDDSMDIDAIEDCILFAHARQIDSRSEIITAKAREQLDALVKQNEQLTARVKELETQARIDLAMIKSLMKGKDTLEQQLKDEKGICLALRSQNSDAVEEVQKLEQQIQQAEQRGYELCIKYNFLSDKLYVTYEGARTGEDAWIKEQAVQERKIGVRK